MTNIYQIFGTVIILLSLMGSFLYAYAQDDDEDEQDEEDQQQNDNDESKDEGDDESKQDEEQPTVTNETIEAVAQQIIDVIKPNETQPVVNPPPEISTPPSQPVANEIPFDAACNCTTDAPPVKPIMQPTITPSQQNNNVIQQIPITSENIKDFESQGKVIDPAYTGYYTVANLFDNKVDDISYWSQAGNSGFLVQLDETINDYEVCGMELNNIPEPKNVPYVLNVFQGNKNYTGVIDQTNEQITFDNCIENMDQILLIFNPENAASTDFISIGEVKLFGKKLGGGEEPTPQQPPTQQPYKNATKVNISNSDALIDIKNSTITFKFDPRSAQATGYNVITIPNSKVVN